MVIKKIKKTIIIYDIYTERNCYKMIFQLKDKLLAEQTVTLIYTLCIQYINISVSYKSKNVFEPYSCYKFCISWIKYLD